MKNKQTITNTYGSKSVSFSWSNPDLVPLKSWPSNLKIKSDSVHFLHDSTACSACRLCNCELALCTFVLVSLPICLYFSLAIIRGKRLGVIPCCFLLLILAMLAFFHTGGNLKLLSRETITKSDVSGSVPRQIQSLMWPQPQKGFRKIRQSGAWVSLRFVPILFLDKINGLS